MATTNNTSKTNTTTNSGNAVSNNIIDALIYTGIKNNLTKTNYTPYDLLLTKIGSTDDQDRLNNILDYTTIKKACCAAKSPFGKSDKYETEIHVFDDTGKKPYIKKKILINKTLCEDYKIYNTQKSCEDFKTLYCENSNFLFNKDNKTEPWMSFSDYCSGYSLIQPPKTSAQLATDKKQQDQITALKDQYTNTSLGKTATPPTTTPPTTTPPTTTPTTTKTDPSGAPVKTPPTVIDKYNAMNANQPPPPPPAPAPPPKNNNMLIIGGVVVCCCCIIIIVAIILMTRKKGKSSKNATVSSKKAAVSSNNAVEGSE